MIPPRSPETLNLQPNMHSYSNFN